MEKIRLVYYLCIKEKDLPESVMPHAVVIRTADGDDPVKYRQYYDKVLRLDYDTAVSTAVSYNHTFWDNTHV